MKSTDHKRSFPDVALPVVSCKYSVGGINFFLLKNIPTSPIYLVNF